MSVDSNVLESVSTFLADRMGLHFPEKRWPDLERGLESAARELDVGNPEEYARRIMSSELTRDQVEFLAMHLTVGETYFFRDASSFELLEHQILPWLLDRREQAGRNIRIWSAACSSGEEPYSIAALLEHSVPELSRWNVTILASDINPKALRKATEGVYGEWSFRNAPAWFRERCFDRVSDRLWRIKPELKARVYFSFLNLATDTYPSLENNTNAMDIVFCRNVLMYFSAGRIRHVAERLFRTLTSGGWLFVAPSEASATYFPMLKTETIGDSIVFRKLEIVGASHAPSDPRNSNGPTRSAALSSAAGSEPTSARPAEKPASVRNSPVHADVRAEEGRTAPPKLQERLERLFAEGRAREAQELALSCIGDEDDPAAIYSILTRAFAGLGRLDDALAWCVKAVESDSVNPVHRYTEAMVLDEMGDAAGAIRALKKAIYLDSGYALAHYALASHYQRAGDFQAADLHFRNALSILHGCPESEPLPDSDGMTAGRLIRIISSSAYDHRRRE